MADNALPSQSPLPSGEPPAQRGQDRWLALVLRAVPLALFLWMVRPLLMPIILGALFALILYPLQRKIAPKLGKVAPYTPAIVTVGALILVVIPVVLISIKAIGAINELVAKDWTQTMNDVQGWTTGRASGYLERFHISPESVRSGVENLAKNAGQSLARWLGGFATAVPAFIVDAFLFTSSLYYFLRDGRRLSLKILKILPFPHHDTEELFDSIVATVNGAILGVIVTAVVQGMLTMATLYILGVPGAFLLGVIATVLAVVPMIGTTPVTVGASIYLFVSGRVGAGIAMIVMTIVIGVSDNVVRPWVQSSRSTMHPLIVLVSIFGGLEVFGAAGIFVGPVLAAIAVWIVDTYADLRLKQLQRDPATAPPSLSPSLVGPRLPPVASPVAASPLVASPVAASPLVANTLASNTLAAGPRAASPPPVSAPTSAAPATLGARRSGAA